MYICKFAKLNFTSFQPPTIFNPQLHIWTGNFKFYSGKISKEKKSEFTDLCWLTFKITIEQYNHNNHKLKTSVWANDSIDCTAGRNI